MKNYKTGNKTYNLILMRKLAGKTSEVRVGDVVLTPRGKTAVVTGWDEFSTFVHVQTTCGQKYLISAPASTFDCWFAEA
jgi:hypothetical protein